MVGLVFYDIMKDMHFAYFTDTVIIMPDNTMEEICDFFAEAYNQAFKSVEVEEDAIEFCNITIKDIKEEVVEKAIEDKLMGEDNRIMALVKEEKNDNSVDLKYHCTSCNYRARRRDTLNQHIKSKHLSRDSPVYACDNCSYESNVIDNFKRHVSYGCRSKSVICPFCEKRCLTKEALRTHKRRHHKDTFKHSFAANEIVGVENKAECAENKTLDTKNKPLDAENKAEYTENTAIDAENRDVDENNINLEKDD